MLLTMVLYLQWKMDHLPWNFIHISAIFSFKFIFANGNYQPTPLLLLSGDAGHIWELRSKG